MIDIILYILGLLSGLLGALCSYWSVFVVELSFLR